MRLWPRDAWFLKSISLLYSNRSLSGANNGKMPNLFLIGAKFIPNNDLLGKMPNRSLSGANNGRARQDAKFIHLNIMTFSSIKGWQ